MSAVRNTCGAGRMRGFTLIEVLTTFVILSVGVLGVVTMLIGSKSSQHEAIQRARAVSIADAMMEKIRANPAGLTGYVTGLGDPVGNESIGAEPDPDCVGEQCSAAQLAAHDLWWWEQMLDGAAVTVTVDGDTDNVAGLREPRGCITFTSWAGKARTGQIRVMVQWQGLKETLDDVDDSDHACAGVEENSDKRRRSVVVSSFVTDFSA
ncbi:MAG: type IV pilus modification protein PilV [Halioglobus sp.]|nr:type IV pilus modification protein PilV [Halioglobus sp.]